MKKKIVATAVLLAGAGVIAALAVFRFGVAPVNADDPPSKLEARLIPTILRASVARRARNEGNPPAATDDSLAAGAEIYAELCARCHGLPGKSPSVLGASFYPPAPQLAEHRSEYQDGELFWIVKHGIRNTGMPAWGRLLSDEDIWQVVSVVKKLDALPEPAAIALRDALKSGQDKSE